MQHILNRGFGIVVMLQFAVVTVNTILLCIQRLVWSQ